MSGGGASASLGGQWRHWWSHHRLYPGGRGRIPRQHAAARRATQHRVELRGHALPLIVAGGALRADDAVALPEQPHGDALRRVVEVRDLPVGDDAAFAITLEAARRIPTNGEHCPDRQAGTRVAFGRHEHDGPDDAVLAPGNVWRYRWLPRQIAHGATSEERELRGVCKGDVGVRVDLRLRGLAARGHGQRGN